MSFNTRPDEEPIYFNNQGLFSDPFLLHHLPDISNKRQTGGNEFVSKFYDCESEQHFIKNYNELLDLWKQKKNVIEKLNEAQLEDDFIKPILKILGFELAVQNLIHKRGKPIKPDCLLFASKNELSQFRDISSDRKYDLALCVAEAKTVSTRLDGKSSKSPTHIISRYIEYIGADWGILTNGVHWRVYSSKSQSKHITFYEINLNTILQSKDKGIFKYFYNFFRKEAFIKDPNLDQSFLDIVYEKGKFYASDIEQNLKGRTFKVVEEICKGISTIDKFDTSTVYQYVLHYVFRLMFILNCESKGLLNVDKQSNYFEYSLRKIVSDIKRQYEQKKTWSNQTTTFDKISALFNIIKSGDKNIGIHGFGKELFAKDFGSFFNNHKIPDHSLNNALLKLAFDGDMNYIDYKRLSEDHLGSIFEGLLEYKLKIADQKLVEKKGKIIDYVNLSDEEKEKLKGTIIQKRDLYLANSLRERKVTGSYYTPQHIVDYIVKNTLEPICGDSVESVLSLRICDPACGSGHFLLGVIKFLEEKIQNILFDKEDTDTDIQSIRWQILNKCIFGADINHNAIELSKLSLWLYTARNGCFLKPLNDQFKCGNSLVEDRELDGFTWKDEFKDVFSKGGFDAIVGNPPYVFARDRKFSKKEKLVYTKFKYSKYQQNTYGLFVERSFELLNKKGRFGFIIPKNWMSIYHMDMFRKMLSHKSKSLIIVNNQYSVFKGVSVGTSIIIVSLEGEGWVYLYNNSGKNGLKLDFVKKQKLSNYNDGKVIDFSKSSSESDKILDRISNNSIKLEKVAIIKCGLKSYEVGKGDPKQTDRMRDNRIYHSKTRKDLSYRMYLEGKDVCRYHTKWSGEYLKYGKNLAAPRKKHLFEGERILIRQIPSPPPYSINACLVSGEELNDLNSMIVKSNDQLKHEFIIGVLNSRIITYWFDVTFQKFQRKIFPQFKVSELKKFPIPVVDLSKQSESKPYDQIISEVKKIDQKYTDIEIGKIPNNTKTKSKIERHNLNIENHLAKLFKLTEEELNYILEYYSKN